MWNKQLTFIPLFALLSVIFSGCSNPVGIQSFGFETPITWDTLEDLKEEAPLIVDDEAKVEQLWWKHFQDTVLDTLIIEALDNNKTIKIATTRIEEARALRLAAFSILLPQVTIRGDASYGNQGFFTNGKVASIDNISVQGDWEVDLFGRNLARLDAANAIVSSEYIMRQAVIVSLLAEVARSYFDLRNFEKQILITKQNLESQNNTLMLTKDQLAGALASEFDVQRSGAQVSTTEARVPALQIAYSLARNRLNVLLGRTPGELDDLLNIQEEFAPLNPQIIIAAPSTVLATRPDVRAAERRFAASISEYEAATKEWLPTMGLLAFFGAQGMTLFNTAPTWNLATNIVQPLINFGSIEAKIQNAGAKQLRAFLEYQQTVLEALENMENALVNYIYEINRNASLRKAAEQNRKALELANEQYTNGYTNLLDLLVVQRNVLETESALTESDAKLRKDLANIYTAAGGGWAY